MKGDQTPTGGWGGRGCSRDEIEADEMNTHKFVNYI